MKTYKLADKIFSRYRKLSPSYMLKLLLNRSEFEPQCSYKLYFHIKKCIYGFEEKYLGKTFNGKCLIYANTSNQVHPCPKLKLKTL